MKLSDTLTTEYANVKSQVHEKLKSPSLDEEVKRILSAYEEVLSFYNYHELRGDKRELMESIIERKTKMKYGSDAVTSASLSLLQFEKDPYFSQTSGIFLSTILQKHFNLHPDEKKYVLITESYDTRHLRFLCSEMKISEVFIQGNCGQFFGRRLSQGKLFVSGNAMDYLGDELNGGEIIVTGSSKKQVGSNMKKGNITVEGNIDSSCGYYMEGGVIHCKSNATYHTGNNMKEGTIVIDGSVEDGTGIDMKGGTIIVNGKTGTNVGQEMSGGKLFLHNKRVSISIVFSSGEIYNKGVRIR